MSDRNRAAIPASRFISADRRIDSGRTIPARPKIGFLLNLAAVQLAEGPLRSETDRIVALLRNDATGQLQTSQPIEFLTCSGRHRCFGVSNLAQIADERGGAARPSEPVHYPAIASLRGRYYIQCDRHQDRKAELMRGGWCKINNSTFAEWPTIVDAYSDCLSVFQIGDAHKRSER
jgi:hypothetical protein